MTRARINIYGVAGFIMASCFAVIQEWSLPEFCWSTWLAGLVLAWLCILTLIFRFILTARSQKTSFETIIPVFKYLPYLIFQIGVTIVVLLAGWLAFRLCNFVFAFYGIFLSVFAAMEPESYFGANGFINSNFYSPVAYLLQNFWPTVLGILIAKINTVQRHFNWKLSLQHLSNEIVCMHIFVLAIPFLSLIIWLILGDNFQTLTIVMLMALLYLFPDKSSADVSDK